MSQWLSAMRARKQAFAQTAKLLPAVPAPAPPSPPPPGPVGRAPAPPPPPPPDAQVSIGDRPLPDVGWIHAGKHKAHGAKGTVAEETDRILGLPYIPPGTPRCPDREGYGRSLLNPQDPLATTQPFRLHPEQIDAAWTYETYGGAVTPLGVGAGKGLLSVLCAIKAIASRGHYRAVILIPPRLVNQTMERLIPQARQRLDCQGLPFRVCAGTAAQRKAVIEQPGRAIYFYTYSSLSAPQSGYEELLALEATAYILDEAQNVSRHNAIRTKRLHAIWNALEQANIFEKHRQMLGREKAIARIEVVPMSGTMVKKSLNDYAHLAASALGMLSPAPIRGLAISTYAACIDSDKVGEAAGTLSSQDGRHLGQFLTWASTQGIDCTIPDRRAEESDEEYRRRCTVRLTLQEQLRNAYRARFNGTPGVVASSDQNVDSSLLIGWHEPIRPADADAANMVHLMRRILEKGETPNGDAISYSMHNFKWLWEISNGFYNSLEWPTAEQVRKNYLQTRQVAITDMEALKLLEHAQDHHRLLMDFRKLLRKFLEKDHIPGCDSPELVATAILRIIEGGENKHKIPRDLIEAYHEQREKGPHRYPDLPERIDNPVKVCDYKIRAAIKRVEPYVADGKGCLLWYHHPIIGRWLHEAFTAAQIPHTFAPAGHDKEAEEAGIVILSYAHHEGKNLQYKQFRNIFVELRREAYIMEQSLGRTHRYGQPQDEVLADLFIANYFDLALYAGTLRDADYIQATMGTKQRLCYASYDPVVPPMNPRLLQRLGIIKSAPEAATGNPWESLTAPDIRDVAQLVRPVAYETPKGR